MCKVQTEIFTLLQLSKAEFIEKLNEMDVSILTKNLYGNNNSLSDDKISEKKK